MQKPERSTPLESLRQLSQSLPGYKSIKKLIIGSENEQWIRIVMNNSTLKLLKNIEHKRFKVLEISGSYWEEKLPFKEYKSVGYPEYDICEEPLSETFDLIIAEQVFEHLLFPYRAANNIYNMLNPGGYFLITTPFLVRYHPQPYDCSRWTKIGIKYFLHESGFDLDKIVSDSWGNSSCLKANLVFWMRYHSLLHSLDNDEFYPLSVWALAQK